MGAQGWEFEFTLYIDSSGVCDLLTTSWPVHERLTPHELSHSTYKTGKHWKVGERMRECRMSQLSFICTGSSDSNSSRLDCAERPEKISFYLPEKSYVWIDFSFVSFFLFFLFGSRMSTRRKNGKHMKSEKVFIIKQATQCTQCRERT